MVNILFFDINENLIKTYKRILGNNTMFKFVNIDFNKLIEKYKIDAYISPANSYGVMTGGE